MTLPVQVRGLNPRWSAGVWQVEGYTTGYAGDGHDRWRALAVDSDGYARVPLFVSRASVTELHMGHPIVARGAGRDLFIHVTRLGDKPFRWHVSVNNPTDHVIRTTLSPGLPLPGLQVPSTPLNLAPGAYQTIPTATP